MAGAQNDDEEASFVAGGSESGWNCGIPLEELDGWGLRFERNEILGDLCKPDDWGGYSYEVKVRLTGGRREGPDNRDEMSRPRP